MTTDKSRGGFFSDLGADLIRVLHGGWILGQMDNKEMKKTRLHRRN